MIGWKQISAVTLEWLPVLAAVLCEAPLAGRVRVAAQFCLLLQGSSCHLLGVEKQSHAATVSLLAELLSPC